MSVRPVTSEWKLIYQRYMRLERTWSVAGACEPIARQFFRRIVHGHQSRAAILREFRSFGLKAPGAELLNEAFFLQQALYPPGRDRPQGRHQDDPLEDVFAAALSMLPHGFWMVSPDRDQLYRGQRNATWQTIPSLFRANNVERSLAELASAVARVRATGLQLDDEQAIAVAQHYSRELGAATWLLDMTYDPRVALFFASDGGRDGDIGTVNCVIRNEWEQLSANGSNRLGKLRVIDPPGILRIERQRASFLDTSHPDLFDQYVTYTVWFPQVGGLRFEEPDAPHPISAEYIYPTQDPVIEALRNASPADVEALTIRPAHDAREPLGTDAYWEIVQSWCRQEGLQIDVDLEGTLRVVCDVHAHLQELRARFEIHERSLFRLHDAAKVVMNGQKSGRFVSPRKALQWSLSGLDPERRAELQAIIDDCARARGHY